MPTYKPAHPDVRFFITSYSIGNYAIHRVVADQNEQDSDRFSDAKCICKTVVARFGTLEDAQRTLDTLNGVAS